MWDVCVCVRACVCERERERTERTLTIKSFYECLYCEVLNWMIRCTVNDHRALDFSISDESHNQIHTSCQSVPRFRQQWLWLVCPLMRAESLRRSLPRPNPYAFKQQGKINYNKHVNSDVPKACSCWNFPPVHLFELIHHSFIRLFHILSLRYRKHRKLSTLWRNLNTWRLKWRLSL